MSTSIRNIVAAAICALVLASAGFAVHEHGRASGQNEGYAVGFSVGKQEAIKDLAAATATKKQEQEQKDADAQRKSDELQARAEKEIAALGKDAQRAKNELAKYLAEGKKNGSQSCTSDSMGGSRVDPGIVGMLNDARAATHLRPGGAPNPRAAQGSDDASPGTAEAVSWSDLALSDLDAVQTYQKVAKQHNELITWVREFCASETQKESGK